MLLLPRVKPLDHTHVIRLKPQHGWLSGKVAEQNTGPANDWSTVPSLSTCRKPKRSSATWLAGAAAALQAAAETAGLVCQCNFT
jgi:hypothetical protein